MAFPAGMEFAVGLLASGNPSIPLCAPSVLPPKVAAAAPAFTSGHIASQAAAVHCRGEPWQARLGEHMGAPLGHNGNPQHAWHTPGVCGCERGEGRVSAAVGS